MARPRAAPVHTNPGRKTCLVCGRKRIAPSACRQCELDAELLGLQICRGLNHQGPRAVPTTNFSRSNRFFCLSCRPRLRVEPVTGKQDPNETRMRLLRACAWFESRDADLAHRQAIAMIVRTGHPSISSVVAMGDDVL